MRWTQAVLLTRARTCGRRSRVVLTPRRWRQVSRRYLRGDGGKKARLTGESTKETVKTIARGMPGCSGVLVVTNSCTLFFIVREAAGASSARHSLRPLFSGGPNVQANLARKTRGEIAKLSLAGCLKPESVARMERSVIRDPTSRKNPGFRFAPSGLRAVFDLSCHCEERQRRSNPFFLCTVKRIASLALAMTVWTRLFEI